MVNPSDEETNTHQRSQTWYKRVPSVWLEKSKEHQLDVGKWVSQQIDQQNGYCTGKAKQLPATGTMVHSDSHNLSQCTTCYCHYLSWICTVKDADTRCLLLTGRKAISC